MTDAATIEPTPRERLENAAGALIGLIEPSPYRTGGDPEVDAALAEVKTALAAVGTAEAVTHTRAANGSAIPTNADADLQVRADALMSAGWRFDLAGVMPDGQVRYQATAPNGVSVVDTDGDFSACVTLAEARRF